MKVAPFRLHRPESVPEAWRLASEFGLDAAYLAGGTELVLLMKLGLAAPAHVIDLKSVESLHAVTVGDGHVDIGACVTHAEIASHDLIRELLPEFARVESIIANRRVRGTGSLVGNLCFADPHSDPATLLSALDATILIGGANGERRLPLVDFAVGPYMTDLAEGELVTSVRVPVPLPGSAIAHERFKLKERPAVTLAAFVTLDGDLVTQARVVAGSVGPRPHRLVSVESAIVESGSQAMSIVKEAAASEVDPTGDDDGSPDYKRHLVGVLSQRALSRILPRTGT
ncbi:MAG: xanthine dehydrogenase family protein subunit M [Armatimonadetes bacterium]|nr:MAG: xanthine dehydrogenase family protein subunit M [Armatimonadota bacterium]